MNNPFSKETSNYKSEAPLTPYQQAAQEWDLRIGSARVQAYNWRLLALIALFATVLLASCLLFVLFSHKERVFIAEVAKEGRIVNVAPLRIEYQPNQAQKEYFIRYFVELIRNLTLDPVAVKENFKLAYQLLDGHGAARFNDYFKQYKPLADIGKKTRVVKIDDIHPISNSTFHLRWFETVINSDGQEEEQKECSGVFTIVIQQPTTREEILRNPLGIYIVDFNINLNKQAT